VDRAIRSRELASLRFSSGAWAIGVLAAAGPTLGDPAWLDFTGRTALAWEDGLAEAPMPAAETAFCILCGPLHDGTPIDRATDATIASWLDRDRGSDRVRFASGATVEGRIARVARRPDGRLAYVDWAEARITRPGTAARDMATYRMLAAGQTVTARAGAVDPSYHADTAFSSVRVPSRAPGDPESARLLALYERAERAHLAGASAVGATFPGVHAALERDHPGEWLLRWNMLESLLKARHDSSLASSLRAELERLEIRFDHREPIASGLRYLARIAA
jgi:hypothetical protein